MLLPTVKSIGNMLHWSSFIWALPAAGRRILHSFVALKVEEVKRLVELSNRVSILLWIPKWSVRVQPSLLK